MAFSLCISLIIIRRTKREEEVSRESVTLTHDCHRGEFGCKSVCWQTLPKFSRIINRFRLQIHTNEKISVCEGKPSPVETGPNRISVFLYEFVLASLPPSMLRGKCPSRDFLLRLLPSPLLATHFDSLPLVHWTTSSFSTSIVFNTLPLFTLRTFTFYS